MFGRSKTAKAKKNAASVSQLALQLAQDKRFRERLLSAVAHGSKARRRTRKDVALTRGVTGLAADNVLLSELRSARDDLLRAYRRLETKRRSHRLRKLTFFAALAALVAVPDLRQRLVNTLGSVAKQRSDLTGLAKRAIANDRGDGRSRSRNLDELTKEELYARAQQADIPGRSEMSKDELVSALRAKS